MLFESRYGRTNSVHRHTLSSSSHRMPTTTGPSTAVGPSYDPGDDALAFAPVAQGRISASAFGRRTIPSHSIPRLHTTTPALSVPMLTETTTARLTPPRGKFLPLSSTALPPRVHRSPHAVHIITSPIANKPTGPCSRLSGGGGAAHPRLCLERFASTSRRRSSKSVPSPSYSSGIWPDFDTHTGLITISG